MKPVGIVGTGLYISVFLLLLLLPIYSDAQESKAKSEVLTLEESTELALENNHSLRAASEKITGAEEKSQEARD